MVKDDEFWLSVFRRTGANHALDGYDALHSLILSGRLTETELRSLAGALRSLEALARDKAAEVESARKRPWEYRK